MYAGRKRRKPAQKGVKPAPADGAKSNPSKRHRDRLNSELDRLAGLLPFPGDVVSSLDKLSILRLSVSFLRTKSFFSAALTNQQANGVNKSAAHGEDGRTPADGRVPEGELLLQALNGFVLVVTAEGVVFFCSHTIQDYLGFHQTDVTHQSVFELVHAEDQQEFRSNLHWALSPPAGLGPPTDPSADADSASSGLVTYDPDRLPPENSSFLERGFVCRFRCLLDNASGFLALSIQGRLKLLHGQSRRPGHSEGNAPPQLALFAVATPLQPPAILEIRTKNMIFRTKHKLDFTPMACDAKGKIVLGYTEAELRVRGSGYQFIHAADMLYCAENHVRMMKTGESGLTVFRLLTKDNRWRWVQANARLVYRNGKPDYIIATQRPLVEEEGGQHLRTRSMHLPFTFATGEALLYHTGLPLHGFPDAAPTARGAKAKRGGLDKSAPDGLDPKSLLGALMSQDESVYVCQPDSEPRTSYHGGPFHGGGEAGRSGPLLAPLDSLSLDGEDTCSNSELFSALENLGLDAEDLELLLLDQRMMKVELDPNRIPSLGDLLTNNEILSFIQDSLEAEQQGGGAEQSQPPAPPLTMQQHPHAHWVLKAENQPDRHPVHFQPPQDPLGPTANGSYVPNGRVEAGHAGYSASGAPCLYQSYHGPQQQPAAPSAPQGPAQSSGLELEQLLGLSSPQRHLLPSEAYSGFTAQDCSHATVDSELLLSSAYIHRCLKPGGAGGAGGASVAAGDGPVSCPDGLSALQDPQTAGIFL